MQIKLNIEKHIDLKDVGLREFFDMISDGFYTIDDKKYGIKDLHLGKSIPHGIKCELEVIESDK